MSEIKSVISELLEAKGIEIIKTPMLLCAMLDDLIPENKTERNICRRVLTPHLEICESLYNLMSVNSYNDNDIEMFKYTLKTDYGFNDEWVNTVIFLFIYEKTPTVGSSKDKMQSKSEVIQKTESTSVLQDNDNKDNWFEYEESEDGIIITKYLRKIQNVTVPDYINGKRVIAIGNKAFYQKKSIKRVIVSKGIMEIGSCCFYNCTNLTSVILPDSCKSIGASAFSGCFSLEDINIPKNGISIASDAFDGCNRLKNNEITRKRDTNGDSETTETFDTVHTEVFVNKPIHSEGKIFYVMHKNGVLEFSGTGKITKLPDIDRTEIKSVVIQEGITHIESYLFQSCTRLTNVFIPKSVQYIGKNPFLMCPHLQNITIDDKNISYSVINNAIYTCLSSQKELVSVLSQCSGCFEVIAGTKIIGENAFSYCMLNQLILPKGLEKICDSAFEYCLGLSSIYIPDSVKYIGFHAFQGCRCLNSISIKNEQMIYDWDPFWNYECFAEIKSRAEIQNQITYESSLRKKQIDFEYTIEQNGVRITNYKGQSENVTFPAYIDNRRVYAIGEHVLGYNSKVENVIIENGVTIIDSFSFWHIESIKSVTLPDSLKEIGSSAFGGCLGLKKIILPNNTERIGYSAFSECVSLEEITLSENLRFIGSECFECCESLKKIVISDGINMIEEAVFKGCDSLEEVILPNGLKTIGKSAFENCSKIRSIIIPDTVEDIGQYAFLGRGNSFKIIAHQGTYAERYAKNNNIELEIIKSIMDSIVITSDLDITYSRQTYDFEYIIENGGVTITKYIGESDTVNVPGIIEGFAVKEIGQGAFKNNRSIKKVILQYGIREIGDDAFANCFHLQTIELPNSVNTIGFSAFDFCLDLKNIKLPDSISTIGAFAFHSCESIEEIIIPKNVLSLPFGVFKNCKSMKSIVIPYNAKSFGEDVFEGCKKLTIYAPKGSAAYNFKFKSGLLRRIKVKELDSFKTVTKR